MPDQTKWTYNAHHSRVQIVNGENAFNYEGDLTIEQMMCLFREWVRLSSHDTQAAEDLDELTDGLQNQVNRLRDASTEQPPA